MGGSVLRNCGRSAASLLVVCTLLLSACSSKTATGTSTPSGGSSAGKTLALGAVLSLTGAGGIYGPQQKNAILLAEEEINQGGINGAKIGLTIVDDQSDKTQGAQQFQTLIQQGRVVGIDLTPMEAIPGAELLTGDFLSDDAAQRLKAALGGAADVVLCDMAAPATGHAQTDHLRIMGLAEAAHAFAREVLRPGAVFVTKVLQGGASRDLLLALKRDFAEVRHVKPPASRADSAEIYVVAKGFRGGDSKAG